MGGREKERERKREDIAFKRQLITAERLT